MQHKTLLANTGDVGSSALARENAANASCERPLSLRILPKEL
jgi:hypothetical protein